VRNWLVVVLLVVVAFMVPSVLLFAHHGTASFDTEKKLTLKGTVTEWFWANPHCFVKFDAQDEKGNVVHWIAETSNPSDMSNLGWSIRSFKPGDQVTVTVTPVRNGRPVGRVVQVVLANGQTLGTRIAGLGVPQEDASKPGVSPK
jgi:hypothetical protein